MVEEDPAESVATTDEQSEAVAAQPEPGALKKITGGFWSFMSKQQYLVVILGLVFGLLILILTPPFQACDEPNHIYNSYRLSEGKILPEMNKGKCGNFIPRGFY